MVLAAAYDKLTLWDALNGAQMAQLEGHRLNLRSCSFSPDGKRIVSCSAYGGQSELKLWDTVARAEVATLAGHLGLVYSFAFSPNGALLASGSEDGSVKLWEVNSGAELATLLGHGSDVQACAFSPDGRLVVSASQDTTLKVWDASARGSLEAEDTDSQKPARPCAYSPDGKQVAAISGYLRPDAASATVIVLWDATLVRHAGTLTGHRADVWDCAYSPDSSKLLSWGGHHRVGEVKLWDAHDGRLLADLAGHEDKIFHCAFSPDGMRIVTADKAANTLRFWDAASGEELARVESEGYYCAYSPDGSRLLTSGADGLVLRDPRSGVELLTLSRDESLCAFSPDGSLLTRGEDGFVLRDIRSGVELLTLPGAKSFCALSPDGKLIVSETRDKKLEVWDAAAGLALTTIEGDTPCAFSPDGKFLALSGRAASSARFSPDLWLWEIAADRLVCEYRCAAWLSGLVWSSDGSRLVIKGPSGCVFLSPENVTAGPLIVTAWRLPQGDGEYAVGCPVCRVWGAVPSYSLGREVSCTGCGARLRLNDFFLEADWRPIAKAWRRDDSQNQ
jgi:WD40 repeat protein